MPAAASPNYTGALFSFLRVLAVALSSAVLPFVLAAGDSDVPVRAVVIAVVSAFLLTVINFFRSGETRFGTPPNPGAPDAVDDIV